MANEKITLAHGAGGKMSAALMRDVILPAFDNPALKEMGDALAQNANQGAEATKAIGIFSKSAVGAMAEAAAGGASSLGILAAGFKVAAAEA